MQLCIYLELSPFPAIVTNRIIAFTITGKGDNPTATNMSHKKMMDSEHLRLELSHTLT